MVILKKTLSLGLLFSAKFKAGSYIAIVLILCALTVAWRFTPLNTVHETQKLLPLALLSKSPFWSGTCIIGIYIIGGLVAFPVFILIPVTAFVAGSLLGCCYSLLGLLVSASVLYILGYKMGHKTVSRLSGSRMDTISRQLAHRRLLTIITLRLLPVAPYTLVNLIAGSFNIPFREYIIGTLIGIFPAVIIMSIIVDNIDKLMSGSVPIGILVLTFFTMIIILAIAWRKQ